MLWPSSKIVDVVSAWIPCWRTRILVYIYTTNMLYWIWARNFITRLVLIKWNGPLYALVLLEAQTTVTYHKFNFRPKMWLVLLEGPQTSMHSCPFRKALSPRIHVVTRLAQTLVIKPEFLPFSFFNRMDNNIFLLTSRKKKKCLLAHLVTINHQCSQDF